MLYYKPNYNLQIFNFELHTLVLRTLCKHAAITTIKSPTHIPSPFVNHPEI